MGPRIDLIGQLTGVDGDSMLRTLFVFFALCFLGGVRAESNFILWDSAIIGSPGNLDSSKSVELLYSTKPLAAGQVITAFVPLGKSYRVMCCLKVQSDRAMSLSQLAENYRYDQDFVRRVRSLKGLSYAYAAEFLPTEQLNKHMKSMAESAGDTYYSAVGLLGLSKLDRIKGSQFEWPEYGQISIETIDIGRARFRHQLRTPSGIVSIEEPSLPD